MTTPPLSTAELQDEYGVHPNITSRIVHLLRQEQLPEDPSIVRGILALYSKNGVGLELNKAYTVYFLMVAVRVSAAGWLALHHPRFMTPTIEYGKALVRAGIHLPSLMVDGPAAGFHAVAGTDVVASHHGVNHPFGEAQAPARDPSHTQVSEAMSQPLLAASLPDLSVESSGFGAEFRPARETIWTDLEAAEGTSGVAVRLAPEEGVDGSQDAVIRPPATLMESVTSPPFPGWRGDEIPPHDLAGPTMVAMDVSREVVSSLAFGDPIQGAVLETQTSEHSPQVLIKTQPENLTAWPSEEARARPPMEPLAEARQVLGEVQYPVESHEMTAQEEQGIEPRIMSLDSGSDMADSAVDPGALVMSDDQKEAAVFDLEDDRVSPGLLLVELSPEPSQGPEGDEGSDGSLGSEMAFQGAAETDMGAATMMRENAGAGLNGREADDFTALEGDQENLDASDQEVERLHTLMFPSQEATSVDSSERETRGWTTAPGLSRMAEQLGGTFQKGSFPTAGGSHQPLHEEAHGLAETTSEVALTASAGVSRVPIWEAEEREAHPAEISEYGQLFPDLEGLTLAVEAMQPYFKFLAEMDAYYVQYPDQKGNQSLGDVQIIGQATRSLLDSLGLLSAGDANLFAPEFEAADAVLTRLLGHY